MRVNFDGGRPFAAIGAPIARALAFLIAAAPVLAVAPAHARDFYQGKTIEFVVSEGVGGGSDILSRLVGKHIGRFLPGEPSIVTKNMPGAGGLAGANYLYNLGARDGTSVGVVEESLYATQLFHMPGLMADIGRFNWIGRIMSNNAAMFAWHSAAVKKIDDAYKTQLVVATPGLSSQMRMTLLRRITHLDLKLVVGHSGTPEAIVAMERGEVDALTAPWKVFRVGHADWLRDKTVNVILQTGMTPAPDLPGVPRVVDLAQNNEQRQILELISLGAEFGRSIVAPPGVPPERVAELRAAFAATIQDPQFQADARTAQLDLDPLTGAGIQAVVDQAFRYPAEIVAKAAELARLQ